MSAVCIYFQVHQPYRVRRYRIFDVGKSHKYFNDESETDLNNDVVLERVIKNCYFPTNELLYKLLQLHPELKLSFSITGILLEQLEEYYPHVLASFQRLVDTGRVEILCETYHHSLAFLYSKSEFRNQVEMQQQIIERLFGVEPKIFRNTELIYNNELGAEIEKLGFTGVLAEGADQVLEGESPGDIYIAAETQNLKMLLKDYKLSDDIAFRFSDAYHAGKPLTAKDFAKKLKSTNSKVVNLFMDYETFGEHQREETGIFEFLKDLPNAILQNPDNTFVMPSEAVNTINSSGTLSIPHYISWADIDRDLSAWLSNSMQHEAMQKLYALEEQVMQSQDKKLISDWRRLQTSDHFYYMCTKWFADGDVHKYFSPYESPYEAFIAFMNVLQDIRVRLGLGENSIEEVQDAEQLISAAPLAALST